MNRYITDFNTSLLPAEKVDTIIIGAGLAGISVAKKLIELGIKPLVITKKPVGTSNSFLAQGGIAGAIGLDDNPDIHYQDTIKAGKGLCIEKNVRVLVEEGIERVIDLINQGVPFDRQSNGKIKLTKEGAHSKKRILHIKDKTGKILTKHLFSQIKNSINILTEYFLEEILTENNKFFGVIISNQKKKLVIYAKSLILATGGYSPIFIRNTSAYRIGGDTIGNMFRVGAILKDLEFIQFHPTAIDLPNTPAFLITEAVRGEGAILIDENNERFIDELKPRDEVAKAIYRKVINNQKVYLDLSPIIKKNIDISKRFPTVYALLKTYKLENSLNKIPVSPAAHFTMGGISSSIDGKTNIDGIFVVGEIANTGVHGANRLASNSLLECVVVGYKTAYSVFMYNMYNDIKQIHIKNKLYNKKELDKEERRKMLFEIKNIMWETAGIERNEKKLKEGLNKISSYLDKSLSYTNTRYITDILLLSKGVLISALNRKESRGSHFRTDYKNSKEEYKKHSIIENRNFKIKLEVN